jgi:hypothetical protein
MLEAQHDQLDAATTEVSDLYPHTKIPADRTAAQK